MQERTTDYWNKTTPAMQGQEQQHNEGPIAKAIEQETAKLPSDVYLWGAVSAMGVSALLQVIGAKSISNFVGLWVPSLLMLGLYNKIVKVMGSEGRWRPM